MSVSSNVEDAVEYIEALNVSLFWYFIKQSRSKQNLCYNCLDFQKNDCLKKLFHKNRLKL